VLSAKESLPFNLKLLIHEYVGDGKLQRARKGTETQAVFKEVPIAFRQITPRWRR
jgi:hypothetical protein